VVGGYVEDGRGESMEFFTIMIIPAGYLEWYSEEWLFHNSVINKKKLYSFVIRPL
jgi:hypothetical protein